MIVAFYIDDEELFVDTECVPRTGETVSINGQRKYRVRAVEWDVFTSPPPSHVVQNTRGYPRQAATVHLEPLEGK